MRCVSAFVLCVGVHADAQRTQPSPQPTMPPTSSRAEESTSADVQVTQRVDKRRRVHQLDEGESPPWDRIRVVFPTESAALLAATARAGRVVVFLKSAACKEPGEPISAPLPQDLQPIGSVQVTGLLPGMTVELGESASWWPASAGRILEGAYEVQAVFDSDASPDGPLAVGNLVSAPAAVEFRRDAQDDVECVLNARIDAPSAPDARRISLVECESPSLSAAAGHRVTHRAWVTFPREYGDLNARRRVWPSVYSFVPPGAGPSTAERLAGGVLADIGPQAVQIIIEMDAPLVDGAACGPRASAFARELVPCLEAEYRLVRDPRARILTGHGVGGWSAIWLLLQHPEAFGAAFASAPLPLDFAEFACADLYRDENLFVDSDGFARPAFREPTGPQHDLVTTLVADQVGWSRAVSPDGMSGYAWDSWERCFSDRDPRTTLSRRICDEVTGSLNPVTVESWAHFDVARQLAAAPEKIGPLLSERVRILVGARDSFYFDRAAIALRNRLDARARTAAEQGHPWPDGPGYIEVVDGATHDTILPLAQVRFGREMRQHFRRNGLHE